MLIFILEDSEQRMVKFRRELIGHTIHHATTVESGTDYVANNKYDLLFLDHDLGGKENVNSFTESTGYQLAEFIASFTPNKNTPCVVHSCNPAGADNIVSVLPHALKVSFIHLDIASAAKWVEKCQ